MTSKIDELAELATVWTDGDFGMQLRGGVDLEKFAELIVREIVNTMEVEASEFYYNEPNDYGAVTVTFFTGSGDPWNNIRGEETQAQFHDGYRGTGRYKLNDNFVKYLMEKIKCMPE